MKQQSIEIEPDKVDPVSAQSHRRLQRAGAAQLLIALHEQGELADPASWTWDVLDSLPSWCLLEAEQRTQLQHVCGAVFLAPVLHRWIDRRCIRAAHELIGESIFERIVREADACADAHSSSSTALASSSEMPPNPTGPEAVANTLMRAGATVMSATLDDRLPIGGLAKTLGHPLGKLDPAVASSLLASAEQWLAEAQSPPCGTYVEFSMQPPATAEGV